MKLKQYNLVHLRLKFYFRFILHVRPALSRGYCYKSFVAREWSVRKVTVKMKLQWLPRGHEAPRPSKHQYTLWLIDELSQTRRGAANITVWEVHIRRTCGQSAWRPPSLLLEWHFDRQSSTDAHNRSRLHAGTVRSGETRDGRPAGREGGREGRRWGRQSAAWLHEETVTQLARGRYVWVNDDIHRFLEMIAAVTSDGRCSHQAHDTRYFFAEPR